MFKPVPGGSVLRLNSYDEDNYIYEIQLPPVGKGINVATGELEDVDILKRSDDPKEQYWQRTTLPKWWDDREADEYLRQETDPDYVDDELEEIREREWRRRLCGVWMWNYNPLLGKSELIYIYGLHYFYLNWWKIDVGYPNFRIVDRDSFYILGYCLEDPDCLGLVEVTKRKNGKCLARDTKIRMYDGTVKSVQDIFEGELVMGDDFTPRKVFGLTSGRENMYRVDPNGDWKGFSCNESHILSLIWKGGLHMSYGWKHDQVVNIPLKKFLDLQKWEKDRFVLYKRKKEVTDSLISKFTVESLGEGDYYGFAVDGNHLFLLADGTVVHNSYRAGAFIYEGISRMEESHGGIQSKTDDDAEEMFSKCVMKPWLKLPSFFRPIYDESKGDRNQSGLFFNEPSRRGKRARRKVSSNALESWIDFKNALDKAYDGPRLQRYVSDESGKLDKKFNIEERQRVVRYTTDIDNEFQGKHLYTTTVEDMESAGSKFQKVWKNSNPAKRDGNNRTITGLYRYFIPGFRTGKVDKYGFTDEEENKRILENQLKAIENDPIAWASHVRKNPPTIRHAFWTDAGQCMYNATKLNRRREQLSMMENYNTRGNFVWKDGVRDSHVIWQPNKAGRWKVCWVFPDPTESNKVIQRGGLWYPKNEFSFISGLDPFQQDAVQNTLRRSDAASYVLKRYDVFEPDPLYNGAFVSQYLYRTPTSSMMHEDMILQCRYFGCPILVETNKAGSLKKYFEDRGYEKFLVWLPGRNEFGVSSTPESKQVMSELNEDYIETKIDIVYFDELIDGWLSFNIAETEKFDQVMGAGWTLVANSRKIINPNKGKLTEITDLMRKYKVKS